jgi:hypothetical protein
MTTIEEMNTTDWFNNEPMRMKVVYDDGSYVMVPTLPLGMTHKYIMNQMIRNKQAADAQAWLMAKNQEILENENIPQILKRVIDSIRKQGKELLPGASEEFKYGYRRAVTETLLNIGNIIYEASKEAETMENCD